MRPPAAVHPSFIRHCLSPRPGPASSQAACQVARRLLLDHGGGASGRRRLHLAPPFLLDGYTPRYQRLSPRDAAEKRALALAHLRNCNLCPRLCGVNRFEKTGVCLIGDKAKVNTIAPHFGEGAHAKREHAFVRAPAEPCIQGHNGSGAVFMSGCNLRCVFCQNHDISHQRNGMDLSPEELAQWYMKLQDVGEVHNINIVTPEHVVPQVALSILEAAQLGLRVPIVYNTSSFDSAASLQLMDGLVDIYLADFKVWSPAASRRLLKVDDYAATARESVKMMHAQVGDLCFTADGLARCGLLVRHLAMPGLQEDGAEIMRFLAAEVSRDCFVHIMDQYHPDAYVGARRGRGRGRGRGKTPGRTDEPEPTAKEGHAADGLRYEDINRAVTNQELAFVQKAAERVGLWRFQDAPKHHGFAI